MKTILTTTLCLLTLGCATHNPDATKQMYAQEKIASNTCMFAADSMGKERKYTVSAETGRSPYTDGTICYANQMRATLTAMNYPQADLVNAFADYVVKLNMARDQGVIDTDTAIKAKEQTAAIYRKAISEKDAKLAAAARSDVFDRIARAGTIYSNAMAEQDRQRRANRPVNCHLVGVYEKNTVVCN